MPTNMNPQSQTSAVILPASGASTPAAGQNLKSACPFGLYTGSLDFTSKQKFAFYDAWAHNWNF